MTPPPAPARTTGRQAIGERAAGHPHGVGGQLRAGTILQGRYRILGPLGTGGMSTVYKAVDLRFANVERICAVKEMFDVVADEQTRKQRLANFEREAGLLAVLSHPFIPKIFDYFLDRGNYYLVQEFIPGQDLETVIEQTPGGLPEAEVLDWGMQICDVFSYLHAQMPAPIIFRDMKPSNVMMRDDRSLMVIDFGIARSFQTLERGTMIGTEGYAPPEQYRGIADPRTDIYALGATLHHLATGNDPRFETPFTFDQRPPRTLNPALSAGFEALILRAVAYAPGDRFASAAEFKAALAGSRRGVASAAQPSPTPPRPRGTRILPVRTVPPSSSVDSMADPRHAPASRVITPLERLVWATATGDEVRGGGEVAGGMVLIGSYDARLYALDLATGAPYWHFTAGRGICSTPIAWHDLGIVGSEDGAIYGVTLADGRLRWRYRTGMAVRSSPRIATAANGGGGVFIGSDDGYLYKLDAANGGLLWRYRTYGPVRSSVAFAHGLAIVGSDDGFIYALSQSTGHQVWRFATGQPVIASPAVDHDNNVVVCGARDGVVYGLEAMGGELRWRFETGGPVLASATLCDDHAYIGSTDGRFYALDIITGKLVWASSHGGRITSTAAVGRDHVYYGGLDGSVICLCRADGSLRWSYLLGRPVPASPTLHDGLLLIGGLDDKVYALATDERVDAGPNGHSA